jgi:hypothetical protein
MRKAMDEHVVSPPPTLEEIEARVGLCLKAQSQFFRVTTLSPKSREEVGALELS